MSFFAWSGAEAINNFGGGFEYGGGELGRELTSVDHIKYKFILVAKQH